MKLKEEKFDIESFIGGWYIPKKVCQDLITFFEKNKQRHQPGLVFHAGLISKLEWTIFLAKL
jgi:hypothetical protein